MTQSQKAFLNKLPTEIWGEICKAAKPKHSWVITYKKKTEISHYDLQKDIKEDIKSFEGKDAWIEYGGGSQPGTVRKVCRIKINTNHPNMFSGYDDTFLTKKYIYDNVIRVSGTEFCARIWSITHKYKTALDIVKQLEDHPYLRFEIKKIEVF
jgi:hypothetical protein